MVTNERNWVRLVVLAGHRIHETSRQGPTVESQQQPETGGHSSPFLKESY